MGLDLYLNRKDQWEKEHNWFEEEEKRCEREHDVNFHTYKGEVEELAYGRKTWELCNYFAGREDSKCIIKDYCYEVTKDAYMELCMKALPYKEFLKAIGEAPMYNELAEQTAEFIYRKVFGEDCADPSIGFAWECNALYSWCFVDNEKILKAFEDGPVVLIMSW